MSKIILFLLLMGVSVMFSCKPEKGTIAERNISEIIKSRRSIRRYQQQEVPLNVLKEIIDDARYAPSGGNRQPWEFIIVQEPALVKALFPNLGWLNPPGAPPAGKEPVAYIIVLGNTKIAPDYEVDCAFASQNIVLSAFARGLGTCIFGSVNRSKLIEILNIPEHLKIFLVISLGYPGEEPAACDLKDNKFRPWVDKQNKLQVPKRRIEDILHIDKY